MFNSSLCYQIYIENDTRYAIITEPVKISILELISMIIIALYLIFLLYTLPKAIRRFKRVSTSVYLRLGYYIFLWLIVLIKISFHITILIKQKGYSSENTLEIISRSLQTSFDDTIEMGVIIFMINGLIGSKRTIVRRVLLQMLAFFIISISLQHILIYGAKAHLYYIESPKDAIYFLIRHFIISVPYIIIIFLKLSKYKRKLPKKRWLTLFIGSMLAIHLFFVVCYGLVIIKVTEGFCMIGIVRVAHFAIFVPLLYFAFLFKFLHKEKIKTKLENEIDYEYHRLDSVNYLSSDFAHSDAEEVFSNLQSYN